MLASTDAPNRAKCAGYTVTGTAVCYASVRCHKQSTVQGMIEKGWKGRDWVGGKRGGRKAGERLGRERAAGVYGEAGWERG